LRALVQWAQSSPGDWAALTPDSWRASPSKPDPTGTAPLIDSTPGWVSGINVQGVWIDWFDHYAIFSRGRGLVIVGWRDDPSWVDERHAYELTFNPLRRDPRHGGAWNTDQHRIVYAEPGGRVAVAWSNVENTIVLPWENFIPPAPALVRHGINLRDDHHEAHKAARSRGRGTNWRDWTEEIPPDELVGGRIPQQRRLGRFNVPPGTKTYYCRDTAEATDAYTADNENDATTGTASAANQSASIKKSSEELAFTFATPSNEPNDSDWPSGTYDVQLDSVSGTGADITFGCLTIGSANGEFARLNSILDTRQEGAVQSQSAFSGTGLKYASNTTWNPTSGSATDRFMIVVAAANAHTKNAQNLTLELNEADDYTSGPWSAGTQTITAQVATVSAASQAGAVAAGAVQVAAVEATVSAAAQAADVAPGQVAIAAVAASASVAAQAADVAPGSVGVAAVEAIATVVSQDAGVSPGPVQVAAVEATATAAAQAADTAIVTTVQAVEATVQAASQAADPIPGAVQVATQAASATVASQAPAAAPGAVQVSAAAAAATAASQPAPVAPGAVQVAAGGGSAAVASQAASAAPGAVQIPAPAATATVASHAADVQQILGATAQMGASVQVASQDPAVAPGSVAISAGAASATVAGQAAVPVLVSRIVAGAASCTVQAIGAAIDVIFVLGFVLGVSQETLALILHASAKIESATIGASPSPVTKSLKV
jgi:hypothetical protein